MKCPKCGGMMRTYNRNGVGIEQCDMCRGIYLDYGEIEALKQREGFAALIDNSLPMGSPAPPGPGITCPKCHGLMRHYNRNGVGIEQCDMCRGMFLDHGELETLKSREAHPRPAAPGWGAPQPAYGHRPGYGYPQGHHYGHGYHHGYHYRPKTVFDLLITT